MKIYKLIPLILLLVYTNAYGAYTGTMPKDIGTSTPLGSENPNILDDVDRENRTVQVNLYRLRFVGTDTTIAANDSWVVGSSSTPFLITMPAASACANSSVTKPFVITNYSTGTITLNISVDGVGSPTVAGSQTMSLFTDGTRWYEIRSKNAYDSDYLAGVIASGYARSGANSDITSITGLTTALPISEGGTGQTTAAAANTAFGLGTGDTPTFTGIVATGSSTLTTLNSSTGNITNLQTTVGTVTTLNSTTGNITNQVTTTGTITTLNSTTGNVTNLVTTAGTVTTLNSTTGNITTGNVTNLATTTGTVTTLNSTTGNITNQATTNGTITTLNSTTGNITNQVTTTGTITTLNNTNLVTTTGTITTLNNTNLSGGSGTFTGNVQMASATGFDYLKQWRVGSTIGTGNVNLAAGLGITFTPTYSNGNGTITVTASGTASAGGWTHTGTQTVGIAGSEIVPHGTVTLDAAYGLAGLTDAWVPNTISLDDITQVTTRPLSNMQGLLSIATQTTGVAFSDVTGSASASQLPTDPVISSNWFVSGTVGGTITGALKIPSGTIAQRPGTPTTGMIRVNTIPATGGSITVSGSYTVHTFTSSGTFSAPNNILEFYNGTWTAVAGSTIPIEYLVVAAGGGGGSGYGGGGGGGGLIYGTMSSSNSIETVTVGAGGAAHTIGNNSSFSTFVAIGGGRGANEYEVGGTGGSGGGGSPNGYAGGTATSGQGYNGGAGFDAAGSNYEGGGGGGAGGLGTNAASLTGGDGGIGLAYSITGTTTYYAGGGGGGGHLSTTHYGNGGLGGGGTATTFHGGSGVPNTGGGGAGASYNGGQGTPGPGGSGIVIIRYITP